MNLFTKQKQTHRLQNQIYGYQRGKGYVCVCVCVCVCVYKKYIYI